jgi:hypothetical protein
MAALAELKKDVEIRRRLMAYQLYQFRRIAEGNMTSMQKIGLMGTLKNGEALEPDERLSMALEDQMARKIQRQAYIKFGRVMRAALRRLWDKTARFLQKWWYRMVAVMTMTLRARQLKLAVLLQGLWAKRKAQGDSSDMVRFLLQKRAATVIQRVGRGYLGRMRLRNRRIFNYSIEQGYVRAQPFDPALASVQPPSTPHFRPYSGPYPSPIQVLSQPPPDAPFHAQHNTPPQVRRREPHGDDLDGDRGHGSLHQQPPRGRLAGAVWPRFRAPWPLSLPAPDLGTPAALSSPPTPWPIFLTLPLATCVRTAPPGVSHRVSLSPWPLSPL